MTYLDPYRQEAHHRWVAQGYCSSISSAKAWCNNRAGHGGEHRAPFMHPPPSMKVTSVTWTTVTEHPRPKVTA